MDSLLFFGGLLLFILLWRSRTRQKKERAEDLDQIESLKSRTSELEFAVRELKHSFQALAAQPPAPQHPVQAQPVTPAPPIKKVPEPEPTSARIAAETWVSQK